MLQCWWRQNERQSSGWLLCSRKRPRPLFVFNLVRFSFPVSRVLRDHIPLAASCQPLLIFSSAGWRFKGPKQANAGLPQLLAADLIHFETALYWHNNNTTTTHPTTAQTKRRRAHQPTSFPLKNRQRPPPAPPYHYPVALSSPATFWFLSPLPRHPRPINSDHIKELSLFGAQVGCRYLPTHPYLSTGLGTLLTQSYFVASASFFSLHLYRPQNSHKLPNASPANGSSLFCFRPTSTCVCPAHTRARSPPHYKQAQQNIISPVPALLHLLASFSPSVSCRPYLHQISIRAS